MIKLDYQNFAKTNREQDTLNPQIFFTNNMSPVVFLFSGPLVNWHRCLNLTLVEGQYTLYKEGRKLRVDMSYSFVSVLRD